jgi:hypothetical protein
MPMIFRSMRVDGGKPMVGCSATIDCVRINNTLAL